MFVARRAPPVSVTPFDEDNPPVATPPVKVDVAEVVAVSTGKTNPVYKVEVGAWKFPTDWTDRIEPGVVVPRPTLPLKYAFAPVTPPSPVGAREKSVFVSSSLMAKGVEAATLS